MEQEQIKVYDDVVLDEKFICKVTEIFSEENQIYYEVIPTTFCGIPRQVTGERLRKLQFN